GSQSLIKNPVHTYIYSGIYNVSLFVSEGTQDNSFIIDHCIEVISIDTSKLNIDFNFTPNPTKGEVIMNLILSQESSCKLILYNEVGQEVKVFELGIKKSGITIFSINFSELNLNEGVYFIKMIAGNENISKRIIYQK
ncbi:MAG: T9SS type A sorting domain-containing protein, partial [Candidatus Kapabacteria bacterium]|nr:T9SS type A sorting domain-containing protein [Candidatus Kapabacteria bacterium]